MAPCKDAMVEKIITIHPENTVKQALEIFEINNIRSLPVVDDNNNLVGMFGLRHLLVSLLPKSVAMEDGLTRLDFAVGGAPAIAKKLKKVHDTPVKEIMDKNPAVLHPETATWEALRVMALHGSPVAIVNEESSQFVGMITRLSLLNDMNQLVEEIEEGKSV